MERIVGKVLENVDVVSIEGQNINRCAKCQFRFGPASKCFKYQVAVKEIPYNEFKNMGIMDRDSERFVVREFICPSCGVLLDVESVTNGEGYLELILKMDSGAVDSNGK